MERQTKTSAEYLEGKQKEVCRSKRPFFSRAKARAFRDRVKRKLGKKQRVYKCPVADDSIGEHFHLATKKASK